MGTTAYGNRSGFVSHLEAWLKDAPDFLQAGDPFLEHGAGCYLLAHDSSIDDDTLIAMFRNKP